MQLIAGEALDRDTCYVALRARDARFDGRFYTAVLTTGIFCRPICPARTPKPENCLFLPTAAAAHRLGFRPCLRCRPEAAPGAAVARGSANTVSRALHLIAEGVLGDGSLEQLSERLGIGPRQLRRLFDRHVGASPVAVAQTQRLLFATKLLTETALPMAQVALASGFKSVRRFNDAFVQTYDRTPSAVRSLRAQPTAAGRGVLLKLPYNPPYDFAGMLEFLAARAIPGVELVEGGAYRRSFAIDRAQGTVEVRMGASREVRDGQADEKPAARDARAHDAVRDGDAPPYARGLGKDAPHLLALIHTTDVAALGTVVARLRRLFDLDADSVVIDAELGRDPALRKRVAARPGVRVPGAWDSFELAVRAVLGQQVSVRAATTFAGRLVAAHGQPLTAAARDPAYPAMLFPLSAVIAGADLTAIGLTRSRSSTLNALASAIASKPSWLQPADSLPGTIEQLQRLPGIGPWTAQYIAMRALREPDAFPFGDLGLLRALATEAGRPTPKELEKRSEAWRPYRAYAALRLWTQ